MYGLANSKAGMVIAAAITALFFTLAAWPHMGSPLHEDPLVLTDDLLRMVTVREWLNGQGWFDPMMYRLGPAPGTVMHWSRLVDLPVGLLIQAGNAFGINGERLAVVVWPFITLTAAIAGFLYAVRSASGSHNMLPSLVIGGFALAGTKMFGSGSIDHHNVQIALAVWLAAMIIPANRSVGHLTAAGVIMSFMLAIGMESLPLVLAGALAIWFRLVSERDSFVPSARAFGLALALTHALLFVLLIAPSRYAVHYCDAFSVFHLAAAGLGGLVLWAGLHPVIGAKVPRVEILAPLAAAAVTLAAVGLLFPDCLGDPISNLDPKVREFWFDTVTETQNLFQIARLDPWLLPAMYVLPLLALLAGAGSLVRNVMPATVVTLLLFIAATTAVTAMQMRMTNFNVTFAALLLSILITSWHANSGETRQFLYLGAILGSCALVWKLLILACISLFSGGETGPLIASGGQGENQKACETQQAIRPLDILGKGLVAASNNLGPIILYRTSHSVLSGPYHRNNNGNLAWIEAAMGDEANARRIFKSTGVTVLAVCPTGADELSLAASAPDGFLSRLIGGSVPAWLEPVAATQASPLRIFLIIP